ncbi:phage tail spike protein [Paenibacillus sp. FSL R10-2796]|uniref:phage tail spike protein n=1 Tax=Paenibacillus sp. FSL R10-2796 TaxID=2954663 RepID=UPI0030D85957
MDYLQSYDKNMKRVGILNDSYDIQRKRRINSDYEISFLVPMNSEDYQEKLLIKGHVKDERGQFYVINSRSRVREERKLTASIMCTHVMFKLTDFKFPYSLYINEAYGVPISRLTNLITEATGGRFTFSIDDTFDLHDVKDFGQGNCLQALNKIVEMYGCEVEPDNFVIHLKKKIGIDDGHQYRIKKNIVSDQFKDDAKSLVTRLYAQMKDGTTWIGQPSSILTNEEKTLLETVPGAIVGGILQVNYLISPYASTWASDSVPYFDDEIIEQDIDPSIDSNTAVNELLRVARQTLREREIPTFEVSVDGADLHKIDREETKPNLGDVVYCYDPDMEMVKLKARITELTEYPFTKEKHAQATIANVMLRDYDDIIADLDKSKKLVDNLYSNGRIRTELFEAVAKQVITDINNSKTELIYPEDGGILAREKTNPLRQVRLTSAGLGISTDGWQTVRSAVTAGGVLAETVIGQFGSFVSMLIGTGNAVTQINTNGIAAGHANFNEAPFRVDMAGNLVANKLTANYASIANSNFSGGAIVGSSINVGNGKFVVNSSGSVYAADGTFQGTINAKGGTFEGNIYSSGEIIGGILTGARFRTSAPGIYPRVEIDPSNIAFGVYSDSNSGISIPAYDGGVSRIILRANGNESTIYNSPSAGLIVSGYGNVTLSGSNVNLSPSSSGLIIVPSWAKIFNGQQTLQDLISDLQSGISSLWSYIYNHTHTVTVPPHNHGNSANLPNTGGGTYATSKP